MEISDIKPLIDSYHRRLSVNIPKYHRYLYSKINWDARIIGIKGARGVGKTTLLLQRIVEHYANVDDVLYASLDDLWFSNHSLMDLVEWASVQGLKKLFLDEVHRCQNWPLLLKNIYDSYPDISIVYTSSSILLMDYGTVDLSRRQTLYSLNGLSFREFIELETDVVISPLSLDNLLRDHVSVALGIARQLKVIPIFKDYLEHGYYPFYRDSLPDYYERLGWTVNTVLDSDLPAVEDITFETIGKVRKLLSLLGPKVPFVPNLSVLWRELSVNNVSGLRMLYALDRARLLSLATSDIKNYKHLSKPDKVFLDNTNLMFVFSSPVNVASARETFFFNQLSAVGKVSIPRKGVFCVDDKYLFEVGGKTKSFDQIADVENSFLATDEVEVGYANRLPLWMFGLLY